MNHSSIHLSFFGIEVQVQSTSSNVLDWLIFDFSRFLVSVPSKKPVVLLCIETKNTPAVPGLVESSHGTEYVLYKKNGDHWVDYYGRAVAHFIPAEERCTLYGADETFVYEKAYLYILSRIGELLDDRGLHRVHGLGFSYRNLGVLYLIPMRGGKSTLALKLRSYPECKLLSDDAPILDDSCKMLPFPVRLGVMEGEAPADVDYSYIRRFHRSGKPAKDLIHPDAMGDFWETDPTRCSVIIAGKWTTDSTPSIHSLSRIALFRLLIRDSVLGYGLPQVVEFFLRMNLMDIFKKTLLVVHRSYAALKLVMNAQGYELHVSKDHEKNISIIMRTLESFSD